MSLPFYTLTNVTSRCDARTIVVEIAAALNIKDESIFNHIYDEAQKCDVLIIQGDIKEVDSGQTCSNFRNKYDQVVNNLVVSNIVKLMNLDKQKIMTSYSRSERYISLCLNGNEKYGEEIVVLTNKKYDDSNTNIVKKFMKYYNLNDKLDIFRQATKGSGGYTYLADCISFILNVLIINDKNMFECRFCESVIHEGCTLRPVVTDGKEWVPESTFNYVYQKQTDKQDLKYQYVTPLPDSIDTVYKILFNLLKLDDNYAKKLVRGYFKRVKTYKRWSDFWVNDIDDAFTFWMIRNAYEVDELDEFDSDIKLQLTYIIDSL